MTNRSIFTHTAFAALSLVAGTAFCTGIASAEEVAPIVAVAPAPSIAMDDNVCVRTEMPGSRIKRTVCQTRADWIATQGVDPVAR